jgi:hypothetical protein
MLHAIKIMVHMVDATFDTGSIWRRTRSHQMASLSGGSGSNGAEDEVALVVGTRGSMADFLLKACNHPIHNSHRKISSGTPLSKSHPSDHYHVMIGKKKQGSLAVVDQGADGTLKRGSSGSDSIAYLTARLARDRPDIRRLPTDTWKKQARQANTALNRIAEQEQRRKARKKTLKSAPSKGIGGGRGFAHGGKHSR